jgi:putative PIN family toxin of toxin-antitoxin system
LPKPIVLDTNFIVSAIILPQSVAAQALEIAFEHFDPVFSKATILELATVLSRPKFDLYAESEVRKLLVKDYAEAAKEISVTTEVTDCIDAKDNKFLALALDAGAKLLVSGDKRHLLSMNPYQGIALIGIREFIDTYQSYA